VVVLLLPLAPTLALNACSADDLPGVGRGDETTTVPDPAVVADSSLSDPAENASSNATLENEPGFQRVDANTATPAQLLATFEANGIVDGGAWVDQVIDHRPYATGDSSGTAFDGLRAALTNAGLDEFAAEAIIASLTT
jgi:hypothetical protein